MKIKACLFDLDGVLVDTAKYHYLAWKRLANDLGFDFTEQDNERLKGVSRMRSLDILLEIGGKSLTDAEKLDVATKKNVWYVDFIEKMPKDEILPGAKEFLEELRQAGVKIALGSASKNAMRILERLEITGYFDAIIDGTKVEKAKPDPEVFLKGAESLGLSAEECVVFEDAEAGVEAAIAGGMKVVGVGDPEILSKADMNINSLAEMSVKRLEYFN
ncbi:beta-phosphoglucomutase [Fulvitalea axinellae]|uniref:Beta-phosphoglucomutase n=1 Tax=Fulvitalea axinellae TaxID=1182444 RepID=A0AAU9DFL3_9BACT|nr:beta-phosphoglucomutase [Fulvitalea axinellae]